MISNNKLARKQKLNGSCSTTKKVFFAFLASNALLLQDGNKKCVGNAFSTGSVTTRRTTSCCRLDFEANVFKIRRRQRQQHNQLLMSKGDVDIDTEVDVVVDKSAAIANESSSANLLNNGVVVPTADTAGGEKIYGDAVKNTLLWVAASCIFGAGLTIVLGPEIGEEFFAGYLIEQSLSVDNLFVFLLLFDYFQVPLENQNRVLNWGIGGATVMRAGMIGLGSVALQNFHEILLVFAGILVYSSVKLLIGEDDEEENLEENTIIQLSRKLINATPNYDGDRFFTVIDGVKQATPLLLCLVAIEISDIVFAVDSVPAVFGVTENPLVVFSSNMFAICGLRSLYVILSKAAADLKYLEPAVAVVLSFIGGKLIGEYFGMKISTELSLGVVATLLGIGIGASVLEKKREQPTIEEIE